MFAPANQSQFNLTITGLDHDFKVLAFEGHEAINQPYHFDIELVSENPNLDLESLLHKSAFLAYGDNAEGVHGLIYRMAQGDSGKRLTRYSLRLVPHIAYLKHRTNQRIFQQLSVPEIITLVLKDHAILSNVFTFIETPTVFPPRDYCTQYDETDLAFIHRLCEEEGIHYHFEHTKDSYHLFFGDHEGAFPVPDRPTAYVQDSGLAAENRVVKRFSLRLETRPSWVTRRDYDFENPDLLVESTFKGWDTEQFKGLPDYEDYDYPGGFTEPGQRGKHLANRALERHRSDYQLAEGKSDQSSLRSGHFLHMTEHPRKDWNQRWLINGIVHEGRQPQALEESMTSETSDSKDDFHQGYRNTFKATPQGVTYRPPFKHRKPKVLGSQTARVTGPAGEDAHTDEYGRVKVQFFWDREGRLDEHSSCWLRVSSSWAGDRYGAIAIPRIGMEVLVTFLEGDPDQPLVTGCLYHGSNAVPYPLPANKTRSVFKTLSSLGGGGSNELRIEDRKGAEEIYLHAQRDWNQKIQNDQIIEVGNERHDIVVANSFTELKAEEHRVTHGDRKVQLKAGDHLEITQSQHLKAGVGQFVEAGQEIHLKAGQKVVIEAGTELTLKAGGHFITIDPSGVWINGAKVGLNAGGGQAKGSGIQLLGPLIPGAAKLNEAGAQPKMGNVQNSLMLKAREQADKRCLICEACREQLMNALGSSGNSQAGSKSTLNESKGA
ncbi:type VI secretion system tip protein VgrG [Pseudomonas sp. D47]|uniref:type VI secretion system Vgr family protein n=1 Tax=Pseudomonas sp. D47 TaxID=3159447 RepID=UPI00387B2381